MCFLTPNCVLCAFIAAMPERVSKGAEELADELSRRVVCGREDNGDVSRSGISR